MYIGVFPVCVYLCTTCIQNWKPEKGMGYPGTGVTDGCKLPPEC